MSGLFPLDLFTLLLFGARPAVGGAHWGRLYAAFAISCMLHATLFVMPYFGASSSAVRQPAARGAPASGPSRVLDVRLEPAGGPVAAVDGKSADGAGAASPPARAAEAEPRAPRQLARGADLLPVPAPVFYTVDQLTKQPEPQSRPELDVPKEMARAVLGKVSLKIWIDERGNVTSVEVEKSNLPATVSGFAAEAFAKLRFAPGEIDGRSVAVQMKMEVIYDPRIKRP